MGIPVTDFFPNGQPPYHENNSDNQLTIPRESRVYMEVILAKTNVNRAPMTRASVVRTLKSFGKTDHEIAEICYLTPLYVSREYTETKPANDNVVLRFQPFNGGCSTLSGRAPVSLPRVSIIDGKAA